jgi:hypothetical protein
MSTTPKPRWWQTIPRVTLPIRVVQNDVPCIALKQIGEDVIIYDVFDDARPRLDADVYCDQLVGKHRNWSPSSSDDERRSGHHRPEVRAATRPTAVVVPYVDELPDVIIID